MPTARISDDARRTLHDLSRRTGQSMQAILDRALEQYRRTAFLEAVNEAYAALRRNPVEWKEELKERRVWEATLADGLEPEKPGNRRRRT